MNNSLLKIMNVLLSMKLYVHAKWEEDGCILVFDFNESDGRFNIAKTTCQLLSNIIT